jgi:hypothetical protein
MRRLLVATAIVAVAGIISFAEARSLWGYAVDPPNLMRVVGQIGRVLAISEVDFTGLLPSRTSAALTQRAEVCRARIASCWSPDWILVRALDGGLSDSSPTVPTQTWKPVWAQFQRDVRQPGIWSSGVWQTIPPAVAIVLQYRQQERELLFIGYNTIRGADDRYGYAEALYQLSGPDARLVATSQYFYDSDRLPHLGTLPLWIVNTLVLLAGAALIRAAAVATDRHKRLAVGVSSLVLLAGVAGYFRVTTSSMHTLGHAPGLVFAVAAALLAAPGLLALYFLVGPSR